MIKTKNFTGDLEELKTFIIIRLIKLAGACEMPRISKKQIQESLINAQKDIEEWKP